jgi:hypothetical protein
LVPEQREFAEPRQAAPHEAVDQREIGLGAAAADIAVFVEIEDADVGHLGRVEVFVKVAGNPFQIGPAPAKAVDASRIEIDADKPAPRQHAIALEHVEGQKPGGAHQLAPIATEARTAIIFPEQMGGFTQDAEIPVPAEGFGGIVEGVVLAVGEIVHERPPSGNTDANRDGVGDVIQLAWRQIAEAAEESGF